MIRKGTPRGIKKLERISVEREQENFAASLLPQVKVITDPVTLIKTIRLHGRVFDQMKNLRTGTEFIHERTTKKPITEVNKHKITVEDIY